MPKFKTSLFLVLCLFLFQYAEGKQSKREVENVLQSSKVMSAVDFISTTKHILREVYDAAHKLLREPNLSWGDAFLRSKEHEIIGRLISIHNKIDEVQREVVGTLATLSHETVQPIWYIIKTEVELNELYKMLTEINLSDEQLKEYLTLRLDVDGITINDTKYSQIFETGNNPKVTKRNTQKRVIERFTLEDFATAATRHGANSIQNILGKVHAQVVPPKDLYLRQGLFEVIGKTLEITESGPDDGTSAEVPKKINQNFKGL